MGSRGQHRQDNAAIMDWISAEDEPDGTNQEMNAPSSGGKTN